MFKISAVATLFSMRGQISKLCILKVIDTRWFGHLRATKSIFKNYEQIMKTLPQITGPAGFDGDDIAIAAGISHFIE